MTVKELAESIPSYAAVNAISQFCGFRSAIGSVLLINQL